MKSLALPFAIASGLALYGTLAFSLGSCTATSACASALRRPLPPSMVRPEPADFGPGEFAEFRSGDTVVRVPIGPNSPVVQMTTTDTAPTHSATVQSDGGSLKTKSEKVAVESKTELPPLGMPSMFGSVQSWLSKGTSFTSNLQGSGPGSEWVLYLLGGVVLVGGVAAFVWGAPSIGLAGVLGGLLLIASVQFPILQITAILVCIGGALWYAFRTRGLRPSLQAITQEIEVLSKGPGNTIVTNPDGSTSQVAVGKAVKIHLDRMLSSSKLAMIDRTIDPLKK